MGSLPPAFLTASGIPLISDPSSSLPRSADQGWPYGQGEHYPEHSLCPGSRGTAGLRARPGLGPTAQPQPQRWWGAGHGSRASPPAWAWLWLTHHALCSPDLYISNVLNTRSFNTSPEITGWGLSLLLFLLLCSWVPCCSWGTGTAEQDWGSSANTRQRKMPKLQEAQVWSHHCLVRDFQAWSLPREILWCLLFERSGNGHPLTWSCVSPAALPAPLRVTARKWGFSARHSDFAILLLIGFYSSQMKLKLSCHSAPISAL